MDKRQKEEENNLVQEIEQLQREIQDDSCFDFKDDLQKYEQEIKTEFDRSNKLRVEQEKLQFEE